MVLVESLKSSNFPFLVPDLTRWGSAAAGNILQFVFPANPVIVVFLLGCSTPSDPSIHRPKVKCDVVAPNDPFGGQSAFQTPIPSSACATSLRRRSRRGTLGPHRHSDKNEPPQEGQNPYRPLPHHPCFSPCCDARRLCTRQFTNQDLSHLPTSIIPHNAVSVPAPDQNEDQP
jgi:hypothetical protein